MRETELKKKKKSLNNVKNSQKEEERIKDMRETIEKVQREPCYVILLHTIASTLYSNAN
jgi:hypothetical protein